MFLSCTGGGGVTFRVLGLNCTEEEGTKEWGLDEGVGCFPLDTGGVRT